MAIKKIYEDGRSMQPLRGTRALETRQRIQVSKILSVLAEHVNGDRQMTATQISAAKLLLDKSLPDLQSITLKSDDATHAPVIISAEDGAVL